MKVDRVTTVLNIDSESKSKIVKWEKGIGKPVVPDKSSEYGKSSTFQLRLFCSCFSGCTAEIEIA